MQRDNPRRAAAELLGMLVIAGVVLAAPFVYATVRVDKALRPEAERVAAIERSDCAQLREQPAIERGNSGVDLRRAGTMQLIVEQSEKLHCRPAIHLPTSSND
jgi:hypothetical protein